MSDSPESLYRMAFDEAQRAWVEQSAAFDRLRGRSAGLLSAAAIALGLIRPNGGWPARASIVLFVALGLVSVVVLWPRKLGVHQDIDRIVRMADGDEDLPSRPMVRQWALQMRDAREKDRTVVRWAFRAFTVQCALLAAVITLAAWAALG